MLDSQRLSFLLELGLLLLLLLLVIASVVRHRDVVGLLEVVSARVGGTLSFSSC